MRHCILFIDDEINVLHAMARLLRRESYRVFCASTASEALVLTVQERPEVVVSDLNMRDCDGLTLLGAILCRHPNVVPILMTGCPSKEAFEAEKHGDLFRVLVKPCGSEEIKATLEAACDFFDRRQARRPPEERDAQAPTRRP